MAIKKGTRVVHAKQREYTGDVTKVFTAVVCDKNVTLIDVDWDIEHNGAVPMRWRDESGTRRGGYKASELEVL